MSDAIKTNIPSRMWLHWTEIETAKEQPAEQVRADYVEVVPAAEVKALETERDGWKAAAKRAARNHLSAEVALDAEREKVARLVEVANGMVEIVEGVRGAMEHGTWRAERSNLRMKDTPEWVALYNARAELASVQEKEGER